MGNLVSIIVPVYGVEKYLPQCVDSLLAQTYENTEIILVDDGSPDGCGAICDEYAARDPRVTALHKKNGGPSSARNSGVSFAHGDWLTFVDGDDYVSPCFVEVLVTAAASSRCSIAILPSGTSFNDGEQCVLENRCDIKNSLRELPAAECLEKMLYQAIDSGLHGRLYHRDILGYDPFPSGMCIGEDIIATYSAVYSSGTVAFVNCRRLYAYRLRKTSLIRQPFQPEKARSAVQFSEWLCGHIPEWYPALAAASASRCFSACRMVYAQIPTASNSPDVDKKCRDDLWSILRNFRFEVLADSRARRRERIAAAAACAGGRIFSVFCRLARSIGLLR